VRDEFVLFWSEVIRKEPSRIKALEAYTKARTRASSEDILAGLRRWRPVWEQIDDPTKIPHITTWLNQDRWTVEAPLMAKSHGRVKEFDATPYLEEQRRLEQLGR
jgi:hypothetical protein